MKGLMPWRRILECVTERVENVERVRERNRALQALCCESARGVC